MWHKIFLLAIPVALQSLLQALLGMADVVMVTGLGAEAVAAVGLAAKLHFLLLVIMFGFSTGAGILIAQYKGAGQLDGCQRIAAVALVVGVVVMMPFGVAFATAGWWLGMINPDPEVVQLAAQYLLITAPTVFFLQAVLIYETAMRSVSQTLSPLIFAAAGAVLNIALNYIFIFGYLGLPPLGVAGAALGTLLSRIFQLIAYWGWFFYKGHFLAPTPRMFTRALRKQEVTRFITFAFPLVLNHGIWGLGNAIYHIGTGFAGTQALAVMGIMVPIESSFFALFIGLAAASAVLVGQELGRDGSNEAWHLHLRFDRLALLLVGAMSIALWVSHPWVLAAVSIENPQTNALLEDALMVFCLMVWVKIMNMLRILGVLRAGGDIRFCLMTDVVVMWIFGVPIYLLAVSLEVPFVLLFALMMLEDVLKFLPVWWRVKSKRWIQNLVRRAESA